jgi:hypothetical protein
MNKQCLVQEALPVTNGRIEFDAKTGGGAAAKKEVSFHQICMKINVISQDIFGKSHSIYMKINVISQDILEMCRNFATYPNSKDTALN